MALRRRDDRHHTYRDYLGWSDDVPCELVEGTAYLKEPAPDLIHQRFVGEIYFQLRAALADVSFEVFVAPVDVRLPSASEVNELVTTVVQPDVCVVCDPTKLDERGIRGAPDLVVEVLSPATAGHDHIVKRRVYERAGVREYWLVHPTDRLVTIYRLENGSFSTPHIQELTGTTPVAILPGVAINWDEMSPSSI